MHKRNRTGRICPPGQAPRASKVALKAHKKASGCAPGAIFEHVGISDSNTHSQGLWKSYPRSLGSARERPEIPSVGGPSFYTFFAKPRLRGPRASPSLPEPACPLTSPKRAARFSGRLQGPNRLQDDPETAPRGRRKALTGSPDRQNQ